MDRDIILEKLKELKAKLQTLISSTDKNEELDALKAARRQLIVETELLKVKLKYESSYISLDYNQNRSKAYEIKQSIENLKTEKNAKQTEFKNYESKKFSNDNSLAKLNERLSEQEKELEKVSEEYRVLGSESTESQDISYGNLMNSIRDEIEYLRVEIGTIGEENEYLSGQLSKCSERISQLDVSIKKYEKILETLNQREKETKSTINSIEKQKDELKYSQNQILISILDYRIELLICDVLESIERLINDFENNVIDEVALIVELNRLKVANKITPVKKDLETFRQIEASLVANKNQLQAKLSSEVNYTPSVLAKEMEDEIKFLENNIANCATNISNVDLAIAGYEKNIVDLQAAINCLNTLNGKLLDENDNYRLLMVITPDITDKEVNDLNKKISKNEKEIKNNLDEVERLRKEIESTNIAISFAKKQRKTLETILNRNGKKILEKNTLLSDTTSIDKQKLESDQNRFASTSILISLLRNYSELHLISDIDNILSYFNFSNEEEVVEEEILDTEEVLEEVIEENGPLTPMWSKAKSVLYDRIHHPIFIDTIGNFFKRLVGKIVEEPSENLALDADDSSLESPDAISADLTEEEYQAYLKWMEENGYSDAKENKPERKR